MTEPHISVIIPTHNRYDVLTELVSVLKRQIALHHFEDQVEIIVIDDNSKPQTTARTRDFLDGLALPYLSFYALEQSKAPRGPAYGRNFGIEKSKGRIILFLDDDLLPADDYLPELIRIHESHPEALIINGHLLPYRKSIFLDFWYVNFQAAFGGKPPEFYPIPRVAIGNCSIKRELLSTVHPLLDETLVSQEDYDLAFRLRAMDIPIYKSDCIVAYNRYTTSLVAFVRKHIWYWKGYMRMLEKYPGHGGRKGLPDIKQPIDEVLAHGGFRLRCRYWLASFPLRILYFLLNLTLLQKRILKKFGSLFQK